MSEQIRALDVVQIAPSVENFGGCFAVVSEVKENGWLEVYIQSPGVAGQTLISLKAGDYALCGVAVWVVGGEEE